MDRERKQIQYQDSFTVSFSGKSSVLEARFFPPIELSPEKNYVLGLIELLTFHSIPNIDESNNKFDVNYQVIEIPTGNYEIEDIESFLQEELKPYGYTLRLEANKNTLQSEIFCSERVDFHNKDSIGSVLGFTPRVLPANEKHISDLPVKILKVNTIRVECYITAGAYINGQQVHTIHEFFPSVPPSYKIIEEPSQVIYLPVTVDRIDNIQLILIDQDGELINFRGEDISIRLHIKST